MSYKNVKNCSNKIPLDLDKLKELYSKNIPIISIAKEMKVSATTIHDRIIELGIRKTSMKNYYEIDGDITRIYVSKRNGKKYTILIDTEDLNKVMNIKNSWSTCDMKNGTYATSYIIENMNQHTTKKTILMHRVILNAPKGKVIDHINHNTLDNRKSNLRIVTISQNVQNLKENRKNNKSGVRGVYFEKRSQKWIAQLTVNKCTRYVGSFQNLEDAKIAIKKARKEHMPYSYEAIEN